VDTTKEELFEPKDVKLLLNKFLEADKILTQTLTTTTTYDDKILSSTKEVIESEVQNTLSSIEIDEINRGDLSVRLSLLKKRGIKTFFDVYKYHNANKLTKIKGLSDYSLYKIKQKVFSSAKEIRDNTVPRISIDNKTKQYTALVRALFLYINSEIFVKTGVEIYKECHQAIQTNAHLINKMTNKLSWFFTTRKNKKFALEAYNQLLKFQNQGLIENITYITSSIYQLETTSNNDVWEDFAKKPAKYFAVLEQLNGFKIKQSSIINNISEDLANQINSYHLTLNGLKCTLRSYQEFGVKYILHQERVLLGDEMGLGKTVQAIAAMVDLRNNDHNRFIVVCPASVLINWCREIELHSDLLPIRLHGDDRDLLFEEWKQNGGVAVTTYETLSKFDFTEVNDISMLVADEAHYVKNPRALRTKTLMKIVETAKRVLFMTGTALENNVEEMYFLINKLQPAVAKSISNLKHLTAAPMFRQKISPVYFRRTREDVLKELPDLIESQEWCEMTQEESEQYYENTMSRNFMAMRQVSWQGDISKSSKAQRLLEIYQKAKDEKRKVIVFSFFLNTIKQVKELIGDNCYGPIDGSVSPEDRLAIIDEFTKAPDGSVLVAQVQAGGTGLNIQAASFVVLCEPQLKPSTENQAISRTYRMGQVRNVMFFRLLCEKSVDERIMEILNAKQDIFDRFADRSAMGEQSIQISEQMQSNIIEKEIERLQLTKQKTAKGE